MNDVSRMYVQVHADQAADVIRTAAQVFDNDGTPMVALDIGDGVKVYATPGQMITTLRAALVQVEAGLDAFLDVEESKREIRATLGVSA